jgi:hypothetical protein
VIALPADPSLADATAEIGLLRNGLEIGKASLFGHKATNSFAFGGTVSLSTIEPGTYQLLVTLTAGKKVVTRQSLFRVVRTLDQNQVQ